MEYVYHVVTERPILLGQELLFDNEHHNGVYDRVMTFERLVDGELVNSGLSNFIKSDMDRWAKVAYREFALEKVRLDKYLNYPSRMACLYTSRTLDEAIKWAEYFQSLGRDVYSIVKLEVDGNIFDGDACNCFDGTDNEEFNIQQAYKYWENNVVNDNPIIETLVDGKITVVEIVVDYKNNDYINRV